MLGHYIEYRKECCLLIELERHRII